MTIWCRYRADGRDNFGLVDGDTVLEADGAPFDGGRPTTRRRNLADVMLLPPVIPGVLYAAGPNYRDHIRRFNEKFGVNVKIPPQPEVGYRANNALIGHEQDIVKPADCGPNFEFEGELVAVIGKTARHVAAKDAAAHIFGWTIGNDVSARTWQFSDRTMWRSKNADTFKPMGPWIVTDPDLSAMRTTVRLNGKVVTSFDTGNTVFTVGEIIAEVTKYNTLHPGDVLWLGTDDLPCNMEPGDVVEVEISGIGTLRNRIVAGR